MTLDAFIELLERIRKEHGGHVPVVWRSILREWEPEPLVKDEEGQKKIILNS